MAVPSKIEREPSVSEVVNDLIQNCKGIVDYHIDHAKLPGNSKQVIRNAMYARVNRLTFAGFGPRVPFNWLGIRK